MSRYDKKHLLWPLKRYLDYTYIPVDYTQITTYHSIMNDNQIELIFKYIKIKACINISSPRHWHQLRGSCPLNQQYVNYHPSYNNLIIDIRIKTQKQWYKRERHIKSFMSNLSIQLYPRTNKINNTQQSHKLYSLETKSAQ